VTALAEVVAERLAPAKVNLALHVVGRRADGYHLLDSLVVFPAIGDRLTLRPAPPGTAAPATLTVTAPPPARAALGPEADNLVLRAARLLAGHAARPLAPVAIELDKRLPVAAGLGGGSADAAAALVLLNDHWRLGLAPAALADLGLKLGADVPMCLAGAPARVGGVGEVLTPAPPLPPAAMLLVNPGVAVATPAVFARLARRDNPPLPELPARWRDCADLCAWLAATRNDLEAAAIAVAPVIAAALAALAATAPGHRGMSGSGASCYALYDRPAAAEAAAARLRRSHPDWWLATAALGARPLASGADAGSLKEALQDR
jgi:4-diphosphocytidyl-2-C-methyl-D-erythritol kinase